jgi:hypothetical protein
MTTSSPLRTYCAARGDPGTAGDIWIRADRSIGRAADCNTARPAGKVERYIAADVVTEKMVWRTRHRQPSRTICIGIEQHAGTSPGATELGL